MASTVTFKGGDGKLYDVEDKPEVVQKWIDSGAEHVPDPNAGGVLSTIGEVARGVDEAIGAHAVTKYNPMNLVPRAVAKGVAAIAGSKPTDEVKASPQPAGTFDAKGPDGKTYTVSDTPENRSKWTESGAEILSGEQRDAAAVAQVEAGPRGAVRSYLDNVGNELGFGIPQMVASPEEKKQFEERNELHELASTAGGAAGLIAGMLIPGVNLAGASGKASQVAVRGAERLGVDGAGVLAKGIGMAAEGAVQAAPRAAGEAIFEGDPAGGAETLLLGIGAGFALGGGSALGKRLLKSAAEKAAPALESASFGQTWKSIGGGHGLQSTKFAKQAERYLPNGVEDIGEVVQRRAGITGGTPGEMLEKIESAHEEVGQGLGKIARDSKAQVEGKLVMQAIDDVVAKYEQSAATKPIARNVRAFGEDLAESLSIKSGDELVNVQDLLRERKAIDRIVYKDNSTVDPKLALELKRDLRSRLEGLITDSLDANSGLASGELKAEYQLLKKDFSALSLAREAAEDSAARVAKGATVSLKDAIVGAHGASTAVHALLGGHPLVAAGSLASGLVHKVAREHGNHAAAVAFKLASKAAKQLGSHLDDVPGALARLGTRAAPSDTVVESFGSMARFVGGDESASKHAQFEAVRDKLADETSDASRRANRLGELAGKLEGLNPEVVQMLSQRSATAVDYVQSVIPKDPTSPEPFSKSSWKPSQADLSAFERRLQVVTDPMSVFREVSRGTLTKEHVEALDAVYPAIALELRKRVLYAAATPTAPTLSTSARKQVELLLGGKGPKAASSYQRFYGPAAGEQPSGGVAPMKLPGAEPTQAQKLAAR